MLYHCFCFQCVYPTKEVSLLDQQQNQRQPQKKVVWITPVLQLLFSICHYGELQLKLGSLYHISSWYCYILSDLGFMLALFHLFNGYINLLLFWVLDIFVLQEYSFIHVFALICIHEYSITRYIRLARLNSSFCTTLRWLTVGLNTFLTFLSFILFCFLRRLPSNIVCMWLDSRAIFEPPKSHYRLTFLLWSSFVVWWNNYNLYLFYCNCKNGLFFWKSSILKT